MGGGRALTSASSPLIIAATPGYGHLRTDRTASARRTPRRRGDHYHGTRLHPIVPDSKDAGTRRRLDCWHRRGRLRRGGGLAGGTRGDGRGETAFAHLQPEQQPQVRHWPSVRRYPRGVCRTRAPPELLYIFGAGHVAYNLYRVAKIAGFDVIVVDDRESYANRERFPEAREVIADDFERVTRHLHVPESVYIVVVTRGHRD